MATYRTSVAGGASSGTSNRTATITPAVGDLLVVFCYVATNTNDTPTCSDNNGSGTYDRIDVANCVTATFDYRLSCFVRTALMTNTTSTIVTVNTGSNSSGCVHVIAITNITRTGASAVRSNGKQNNQAAGTAAPVLNQTSLTTNLTLVAHGSADTTTTQPSGWTEAQDNSFTNETVALETAYRDSGFAGTTITFGAASSTTFCSMAIELDAVLHKTGADTLDNWLDARRLGYGLNIPPEDLNLWGDTHAKTLGGTTPLTQSVDDDLDAWADDLTGDLKSRWLDSHVLDLQDATEPALTLELFDDADNLADDFTGDLQPRWRDSLALDLQSEGEPDLTLTRNDDLNNWNDFPQVGYGLLISENAGALADSLIVGYGLLLSDDANTLADSLTIGYGLQTADDANALTDDLTGDLKTRWQDSLVKDLSSDGQLTITRGDSFLVTDGTATMFVLGYDVLVWNGQNLNNWDDDITTSLEAAGLILWP